MQNILAETRVQRYEKNRIEILEYVREANGVK